MEVPSFVWARDIKVRIEGADLEVSGVLPISKEDREAAPDAFRAYRQAVSRYSGAKRQGTNSPHIQFANANDTLKQVAFVKQYGPITVSSFCKELRGRCAHHPKTPIFREVVIAHQDLEELAGEQLLYRSAVILTAELQLGEDANFEVIRECVSQIDAKVSDWPRQWDRERRMRRSGLGYEAEPDWHFEQADYEALRRSAWMLTLDPTRAIAPGFYPIDSAPTILCALLNAFRPRVYYWGKVPIEAPGTDLAGGIRPILYSILRREVLQRGSIAICRNTDCRAAFELERSGQEFCGEECSRRQRQREYWRVRGKRLRKSRRLNGNAS